MTTKMNVLQIIVGFEQVVYDGQMAFLWWQFDRHAQVFESSSIRLGFPGYSPKVEAYGKDSFIRICCQAPEVGFSFFFLSSLTAKFQYGILFHVSTFFVSFVSRIVSFHSNSIINYRFIRTYVLSLLMLLQVISRGKVGLQGDVYGFGILLWEISTLREAYTEMDDIELAKFLHDGGLPELSSITNHDLRRTIISACQYDPDERLHIKEIHPTAEWWTL